MACATAVAFRPQSPRKSGENPPARREAVVGQFRQRDGQQAGKMAQPVVCFDAGGNHAVERIRRRDIPP
jgi:hypothetical protein